MIQAITIPDGRYADYSKSCGLIQKHIFPGGHLPSPGSIRELAGESGGMQVLSMDGFGKDYAETLEPLGKGFQPKQFQGVSARVR